MPGFNLRVSPAVGLLMPLQGAGCTQFRQFSSCRHSPASWGERGACASVLVFRATCGQLAPWGPECGRPEPEPAESGGQPRQGATGALPSPKVLPEHSPPGVLLTFVWSPKMVILTNGSIWCLFGRRVTDLFHHAEKPPAMTLREPVFPPSPSVLPAWGKRRASMGGRCWQLTAPSGLLVTLSRHKRRTWRSPSLPAQARQQPGAEGAQVRASVPRH